jgi:hypothetical protein
MTPPSGVVNFLLQGALRVRIGLGRASEFHSSTNVVSAVFAIFAILAWQTNLQGDSVPRHQVRDTRSNCDNSSAGLVAERQRLSNNNVSISVVAEVMQVGATETGRLHRDLNFVCCGLREVAVFLKLWSAS